MESAVVKGKKKKGAQHLHPTTVLCNVTTKGGHQYKVTCRALGETIGLFPSNACIIVVLRSDGHVDVSI